MNHHIQHQHLDIVWNGPENEALVFQQRLSDWALSTLVPAVSRALDACVSEDMHLYIAQLDIEIDPIGVGQWQEVLPRQIAKAVVAAVSDKLHITQQGHLHDAALQTTAERAIEAFLYFLQTGALPWHYSAAEARQWEISLRPLFQQSAFQSAMQSVLSDTVARERLVIQFSETFLEELLTIFRPQIVLQVEELRKHIESSVGLSVFYKSLIVNKINLEIWASIAKKENIEVASVLGKVLTQLPQSERNWPAFFVPILEDTSIPLAAKNTLLPTSQSNQSSLQTPKFPFRVALPVADIYLANAGIVLLYPFLPRFFESILCVADDELLRPEKAALALYFLTTGHTQAAEYELSLAKILCGIPLDKPLPTITDWDTNDTEEAEAVLYAVVKYWEALKDSSIDLLRAEFLQRVGKLTRRYDGWLLQVERRDFDFLLDQLPWGFSTIKLPWMNEFLYVEWY